ncbi:hypothetical protein RHMOL_Rhmol11G0008700 [Rhododendron molle]|uniref:Uncharacterized protein n=1 Tax=Rhododendron molle TaxID=49168 RepID=A0ACC0LNB4_RHOML|nr:hypothetical protein RHMOL_Rhmol11G0008700 [Rhododendron molle]
MNQQSSSKDKLEEQSTQNPDNVEKEIKEFFDFLKIPFEELVAEKSAEFTSCIESLSQKHVFPLKEQIVLENFASSLNDTISLFRYYKGENGQKQELIDNLSNVTAKFSTMHNDASTLKSRLLAIDQEE